MGSTTNMIAEHRSLRLAAVAAIALPLLASCANENLGSEADQLVTDVRGLPGVTDASVDYTAPVTLDTGKLDVTITMSSEPSKKQVEAVGRMVYVAFSGTHEGEEGDVTVTAGDDTLHLRSFEPIAAVDAIVKEWGVAADTFALGSVRSEILADGITSGRKFTSSHVVSAPDGTSATVTDTLDTLRSQFGDDPQRGWGVATPDGSGLGRDLGFPTGATQTVWRGLQSEAASMQKEAVVGIDLREAPDAKGRKPIDVVSTTVTGRTGPLDLDDEKVQQRLVAVANEHAASLRAATRSYAYYLVVDGEQVASIDPGLCSTDNLTVGPIDKALRTPQNCAEG